MIGYAISLLVLAVMTTCAWRPPRRPPWLRAFGYHAGWLVNEVPVVAFVALVASTALTVTEGHFAPFGPFQVISAAVAIMISSMLLSIFVRSLSARGAFAEAFGRAAIPTPAAPSRWSTVSQVLSPVGSRRGIARDRSLQYGEHGTRNTLDVYYPRDSGSAPIQGVFIHFHGGHFRLGRKSTQSMPLIRYLVRQGWVCVSANYRLEPRWSYPAYVIDAKRVIAWVRRHSGNYGASGRCIVVSGDSAGAYLAEHVALRAREPALQPGFEDVDTSVDGVIALYGYYGPTSADPESAVAHHAGSHHPPAMVVHGDLDSSVPIDWARQAIGRLQRTATAPIVYVELPGAQHTFDYVRSVRTSELCRYASGFLQWLTSQRQTELTGRKHHV